MAHGTCSGHYTKITLHYPSGTVTATGTVANNAAGGYGVYAASAANLFNYGRIQETGSGGYAIEFAAGGSITNGSTSVTTALINGGGGTGIELKGNGAVVNFGTIEGYSKAIYIADNGIVTNGAASDTAALISDRNGFGIIIKGAGTVANYGTIIGQTASGGRGYAALSITGSGSISNGSSADTTALLEAYAGIENAGTANMTNFGTIIGIGAFGVYADAGLLTNGSSADTSALIEGANYGIETRGTANITNYGTIVGTGGLGVYIASGTIINGSSADTSAKISGASYGISARGTANLTNFGTIIGASGGIAVYVGGVTNGSSADTSALIEGYKGILNLGSASVINWGTIFGTGVGDANADAVSLDSGTVINFGTLDGAGIGVYSVGPAVLTNSGLIEGGSFGIRVTNTITVTNSGLIEGATVGIYSYNTGTVTNFGTVESSGGTAIAFHAGGVLIDEAGSLFIGAVNGGSGTLELAGIGGTISGLGSQFTGFGANDVLAGASWTAAGYNSLSALLVAGGGTLINGGTVADSGSLTVQGILRNNSTLLPTGSVSVSGGTLINSGVISSGTTTAVQLGAGSTLVNGGTITNSSGTSGTSVRFTAAGGTLVDETGAVLVGRVIGDGGTLDLVGAGGTFGMMPTFSGFSTIDVAAGTQWIFSGTNALLNAAGTISNLGTIENTATSGAGISLTAAGSVVTNGAGALIEGATGLYLGAAGTVTNYGTIASTSGTSGVALQFKSSSDVLVEEASGVFIGRVAGGGGTLDLAGVGGTIAGLGSQYTGFSLYQLSPGASWTLGGTNTVASAITVQGTGTLDVAGTLSSSSGTGGTVVQFTSPTDVLVDTAGTVFNGIVQGDGGTLALAGVGGTLTGLGATFVSFASVGVLAGGSWTSNNTLAITNGDFFDAGTFVNNGGLTVTGTAVVTGTLAGTGSVAIAGTLDNFGTIVQTVSATTATSLIIDEAGSSFLGGASGDGGTLALSGVGGTIAGLGTSFTGFGTVEVLAGASFTAAGTNTSAGITIAGTLLDTGFLSLSGATAVSGLLEVSGGSLVNSGTVAITGTSGVYVANGAVFTNTGSILSTASGGVGVALSAAGGHLPTLVNSGTVSATGSSSIGVDVTGGGRVTNQVGGYISGTTGFLAIEGTTLTNFGRIASTAFAGGVAIQFEQPDVLNDEAGSSIVGLVLGDGGSLDLVGGNTSAPGTISGLGSQFTGFANYALSGAWMFTGSNTIGAAGNLRSTGALIDDGYLEIDGGGVFSGPISGTGTLVLDGIESFHSQNTVTVADLVVNGGTATTTEGFKDANVFTLAGGNLALTGQSVTLTGTAVVSGGTVVGSGGFDTTGMTDVTGGDFGGRSVWQNSGTVIETGSVTFGNATGDGQLTNAAGGVFDMTNAAGVSVTGDGGGVLNHGLFEKTGGTGDSLIQGSMNNAANILVTSGTLHFVGAVSGSGTATVDPAAELRFNAAVASTQTISFSGSGGELSLSESAGSLSSFAAGISGFGQGDGILIGAFAYSGNPQVHWTQQGAKGTLAITDNGTTLNLILFGQYAAGTFAANNSGGATLVTYTPPPQQVVGIPHH